MRFLSRVSRLGRKLLGDYRIDPAHTSLDRLRICRIEEMEPRQYLTADLAVGAVYFEAASGNDSVPNTFQITFQGGAAGTQLTKILINGEKNGTSRQASDVFFDTAPGGLGAFLSSPLNIVSHNGFQVVNSSVVDGGSTLEIDLSGFVAGDKLVFTIDVDEVQAIDPVTGAVSTNAIAEGAEFQGSHFDATFSAPHYYDATASTIFLDSYDPTFASVAEVTGTQLNLPPDRYDPTVDESDRTAGAAANQPQVPLPNTLSGTVFDDSNVNNHQDAGEPGIAGVTLSLLELVGTQYVSTGMTTTTDANGDYEFDSLAPDTYQVVETQPAGYFSVGATAGTVDGLTRGVVTTPDILSDIQLLGGDHSIQNDFAEALPNSLSGHVLVDTNGDCIQEPGEVLLSGVVIHLLDSSGNIVQTTTTGADGLYHFTDLAPGTYGVEKVQPAGYFEQASHVGSAGGEVVNLDEVDQVTLTSGIDGVNYNFCIKPPAGISGYVYSDLNDNGVFDSGEKGIAGVTLNLVDAQGKPTGATTKTDANGHYQFDGLYPATYGVAEVQPAGYLDGLDSAGSAGGTAMNPGDLITGAVLNPGVEAVNYDFGELLPGSISGHVLVDTNGDCIQEPGEILLSGVTINLLDSSGKIIQTTTTGADGNYHFTNLAPGNYGVEKVQPAGYFEQASHIGSAGGEIVNQDEVDDIQLGSGVDATGYNYCIMPPAGISGYVYSDLNDNGVFDSGEQGIAGVTLNLVDAQGKPTGATTKTDSTGHYEFDGLHPGTYGVAEVQPAGYLDGLDSAGSAGGTAMNPGDLITGAVLNPGVKAVNYDFGELLPGSINGNVLVDNNGDGVQEPGEILLPGVTINLLDSSGNIIQTTTTGADGNYHFTNLAPGTYGVEKVQPDGYFEESSLVGSAGGQVVSPDEVNTINLGSDVDGINYNFCITPPAFLSGIVFQDGPPIPTLPGQTIDVTTVRDGIYRAGDPLLAGVTMQLVNGVTGVPILGSTALPGYYAPDSPIQTVTDQNGHYEFDGLAQGNYGVFEIKPKGYIDGINTPGSLGGIAFSPNTVVSQQFLETLAIGVVPDNNAIIRIALPAGKSSIDNNFSEVLETVTIPSHPIPPTLPSPPPPPAAEQIMEPATPPAPFAPVSPMLYTPPPMYYGSDLVAYTWHLSVINAGQPRDSEVPEASVQLTEVTQEEIVAWQKTLGESEWILASRTDDGGVSVRHVLFGIKGGIPVTGDFNGDGITDVGVYKDGEWFIDLNGNGVWDEGDLWAKLGSGVDKPVTGDWDGDGKTDIGIYGPAWAGDPRAVAEEPGIPNSQNWHVDVHKNIPRPPQKTPLGLRALKRTVKGSIRADVIDHVFHYGTPGDVPVTGDWNGDGTATIGIFHDGNWYLDLDGDGKWTEKDGVVHFGQKGDIPVVGDFNGDGITKIGVYRNGVWYLDTNGNHQLDADDQVIKLGEPGDIPVVGDWDGSGRVQIGVYRDTAGVRSVNAEPASATPTPSAAR